MASASNSLLIKNGTVITVNSHREVHMPGYVQVREGRIADVGQGEPHDSGDAEVVIDARGGIVHPGLIDGHAHTAWGLARCLVPLHYDIERSYLTCEAPLSAAVKDEDEALGTALACAEMALNGTTCFADTGSAARRLDGVVEGIESVGIRGMISFFNADNAPELGTINTGTQECLNRIEAGFQLLPPGRGRVWACAGLLGVNHTTDELVREAKGLASAHEGQLNIHKSSRPQEVEIARRRLGKDPILGLWDLGVLGPHTTLVHVNLCTDDEMRMLTESGTCVVHCPSASRLYGLGVASSRGRFPELSIAGAAVGLGTDSTIFPNNWDLLRQAYLAATLHRDGSDRPLILAGDILEMATLGGAACVGRLHDLGSLEPGKRADLVIHHERRPEVHPLIHAADTLVFSAGSRAVDKVLVDGEVIVDDGRLQRSDLASVIAEADQAARRLLGAAGLRRSDSWPTGRQVH